MAEYYSIVCKCISHAKCAVYNMLQIILFVQCKLYFREATKAKQHNAPYDSD